MNSVTTSSAISELTRVLLDANIIAKPVTRTLLVVARRRGSGCRSDEGGGVVFACRAFPRPQVRLVGAHGLDGQFGAARLVAWCVQAASGRGLRHLDVVGSGDDARGPAAQQLVNGPITLIAVIRARVAEQRDRRHAERESVEYTISEDAPLLTSTRT